MAEDRCRRGLALGCGLGCTAWCGLGFRVWVRVWIRVWVSGGGPVSSGPDTYERVRVWVRVYDVVRFRVKGVG